jgi:hypothetical protein
MNAVPHRIGTRAHLQEGTSRVVKPSAVLLRTSSATVNLGPQKRRTPARPQRGRRPGDTKTANGL